MQKYAFNIRLYMRLGKRLGKRLISVLLTGLACHNSMACRSSQIACSEVQNI